MERISATRNLAVAKDADELGREFERVAASGGGYYFAGGCIEQGLGPRLDQSCHDSIGMDIEAIGLYGGEHYFANLVRIGACG